MWNRLFFGAMAAILLCSCEESQNIDLPTPAPTPTATPKPKPVVILKTRYGTATGFVDVTSSIKSDAQTGITRISVNSGLTVSDPAPRERKVLTVLYRSSQGTFKISALDGQNIILPPDSNLGVAVTLAADNSAPKSTPSDIAYLKKRKTIVTDEGIIGFNPGIPLKIISTEGNNVVLESRNDRITVSKNEVVGSLEGFNAARRSEFTPEQIIDEELSIATVATPTPRPNLVAVNAPRIENPISPENLASQQLEKQIRVLEIQLKAVGRAWQQAKDAVSRGGGREENSPNCQRFAAAYKSLTNQIQSLREEQQRVDIP